MQLAPLLIEAARKNILPLTGRCNLSCIFCSHRYNPPEIDVFELPSLPWEKIEVLLDLLDPSSRIVIGESATRLREGEPFLHPRIREVLFLIREKFPQTPLQITTNGSRLNFALVKAVEELQPLELVISLNSSSPEGRRLLMKDPFPRRALKLMDHLAGHNIPFHGSVMALPHLVGWEDLRETLLYLDRRGARTIRLFKPGFTRFTPDELLPPPSARSRLGYFIKEMQELLKCPLLPEPPGIMDLKPSVEGVIAFTPAWRAGLQKKDLLVSVEEVKPRCRVEAFQTIRKNKDPRVQIQRDGRYKKLVIHKEEGEQSGITMHYDLDPQHLTLVQKYAERRNRILLLTSFEAAPLWEAAGKLFPGNHLQIEAVAASFWGGTICSAGLLTVDDLQRTISNLSLAAEPEVVLLPPRAFDPGGRDLLGRNYLELAPLFSKHTQIVA